MISPDVSVIIVSYNTEELTRRCLRRLRHGVDGEREGVVA